MNTKLSFLYYAVRRENYIIRVGLPYTPEMAAFQKPEISSIGYTVFLFLLVVLSLSFILIYFKQSINDLMYFILSFRNNKKVPDDFFIRDSELNEIQSKIVEIFEQLESSKQTILPETEKLLQHFHFEEEGISFFTSSFENIYTNSHFIQHLNVLLNQLTFDVKNLFKSPVFSEITHFLENPGKKDTFSKKIYANGRHFFVQAVIFDDKSFEIIIRDISESEKNDFDRTVMITNIAHELRTPVTSVCAYLETLIEHKNLNPEKRDDYIQRAYLQIMRLSDLIQDVTLLTKTKEAPQNFTLEDVSIYEMLQELIEIDTKSFIEKNKSIINLLVQKNTMVRGNYTLLYSIFRNLLNNALKYAGEKSIITIHNYMEDNEYYYFSFSDNGKGVEEKHIGSIFERFYRIAEGRTRDKGGSGLGLSIVKDAVNFHQGEIIAKNRAEGGLEFLFTICKSCV
jgi:signal transduction histidine kinase